MTVALMFPGQGSQTAGFLHALPDHPSVRETLQEVSALLGHDVLTLDSEASLASTVSTQIALLTAGAAFARLCASENIEPVAAAGMSVGVYAAAVAAGSIKLAAALALVRLRAQLMEKAFPAGTYGMAVVEGLHLRAVDALMHQTDVVIANYNAPTQVVLSGRLEEIKRLMQLAVAQGAHTARLLRMNVASHTPALLAAAHELAQFARDFEVTAPRLPIYSNRTARVLTTADAVREELAANMAYPVRWHDIVTALGSLGVTLLIEAPPGHTLSNLASSILPEVSAMPAGESRWDLVLRAVKRASA